ncbi:MAG: sulfite exporter TauE/SafE family protein [Spongiibacteraceae bacterium]
MLEWISSDYALLSSLALGFSLGFIHAFDLDHVMAVSVMANRKTNIRHCINYTGRWALGHGSVLLTVGILLFTVGIKLPPVVAEISEKLIGILLIIFGVLLVCQITLRNGFPGKSETTAANEKKTTKTPFLVGIIHGVAGNAPVLAMLPALAQDNMISAISYLLLFSIGLLISMTLFGMTLGNIQHWLKQHGENYFNYSGIAMGTSSIAVGAIWLGAT